MNRQGTTELSLTAEQREVCRNRIFSGKAGWALQGMQNRHRKSLPLLTGHRKTPVLLTGHRKAGTDPAETEDRTAAMRAEEAPCKQIFFKKKIFCCFSAVLTVECHYLTRHRNVIRSYNQTFRSGTER